VGQVALLPCFWFFENIYPISIRLGIPLILIICYSSTLSGGVEHLLLSWDDWVVFGEFVGVFLLDDVTLAQAVL
jgi:hypothetical protein